MSSIPEAEIIFPPKYILAQKERDLIEWIDGFRWGFLISAIAILIAGVITKNILVILLTVPFWAGSCTASFFMPFTKKPSGKVL